MDYELYILKFLTINETFISEWISDRDRDDAATTTKEKKGNYLFQKFILNYQKINLSKQQCL